MKVRYLAWILPVLFFSCTKNQPTPTNQYADFAFSTQYDSVLSAYPDSSFVFYFNVKVLSGNIADNPITYSISHLPSTVTAVPSTLVVTYLLGGVFNFSTGNIPIGIDTLNFTINSAVYGAQNHKLILKINPLPDMAPKLAGTYRNSYDYCEPADTINYYTTIVSTVANSPYQLRISNIKNFGAGFVVKGSVSSFITIPVQVVDGYTIWGTGTYTKDSRPAYDTVWQMTINDTVVHGLDTERCIMHLQK